MIKLNLNPDRAFLRQFAWASLVMFPLLGAVLSWQAGLSVLGGVIIGLVGLLVFVVQIVLLPWLGEAAARLLELAVPKTVFRLLTLVTVPIGFVVSHVLMALIYYLVMTPIGLVFRLMGRDAMRRRKEPTASSFWLERGEPRSPANYFKLY